MPTTITALSDCRVIQSNTSWDPDINVYELPDDRWDDEGDCWILPTKDEVIKDLQARGLNELAKGYIHMDGATIKILDCYNKNVTYSIHPLIDVFNSNEDKSEVDELKVNESTTIRFVDNMVIYKVGMLGDNYEDDDLGIAYDDYLQAEAESHAGYITDNLCIIRPIKNVEHELTNPGWGITTIYIQF